MKLIIHTHEVICIQALIFHTTRFERLAAVQLERMPVDLLQPDSLLRAVKNNCSNDRKYGTIESTITKRS